MALRQRALAAEESQRRCSAATPPCPEGQASKAIFFQTFPPPCRRRRFLPPPRPGPPCPRPGLPCPRPWAPSPCPGPPGPRRRLLPACRPSSDMGTSSARSTFFVALTLSEQFPCFRPVRGPSPRDPFLFLPGISASFLPAARSRCWDKCAQGSFNYVEKSRNLPPKMGGDGAAEALWSPPSGPG
jgi:hypothetical protein